MSDNANNELSEQNNNTSIEPYTQIPNWFFELGLDPTELLIFVRVYSYSRNNQPYIESNSTLSKRLNVAERTIRRKKEYLVNKNMLIKISGQRGKTDTYKVNFEHICSISKSNTNIKLGQIDRGQIDLGQKVRTPRTNCPNTADKLTYNNNKYNNKYNNIFLLENGKELLNFYTNNIAVDISHTAIQILTDLINHYSNDDILEAMKKTMEKQDALKDIAFMKYTRGILQNWKEYGKKSKATIPAKNQTKGSEKAHGANAKKVDNFTAEEIDWSQFD